MIDVTVDADGQETVVHGARADGTLRAGDVVELRVRQDALLSWFAPDPIEAAENVARELTSERLTFRDEQRPDVRGWIGDLVSATGFEDAVSGDVFVDVTIRIVEFDSRPPEIVGEEELQAGFPIVTFVVVVVGSIAPLLAASYLVETMRITAVDVGDAFGGKSAFGFGLVDLGFFALATWLVVTWLKKRGAS